MWSGLSDPYMYSKRQLAFGPHADETWRGYAVAF